MKFWCASANSSKQRKSLNKKSIKPNDSLSSSASYATISSIPIPKSDSGYSEISSSIPSCSYLEQILVLERTHYENLKEFIIKYSRPLRRFLNPEEIMELFQNVEKICAISESVVRQWEKLLEEETISNHISIPSIYQSWFGLMINSYHTYISGCLKAQRRLNQCQNKISYFLQIPIELIRRELSEFILLPIRYICILNEFFQSFMSEYSDLMNHLDWKIIQNVGLLAKKANNILLPSCYDLDSLPDITLQSEISPLVVLQRTEKEPWEPKRLELSDSRLLFTQVNRTSSIRLSNIVHIEEDFPNTELRLIIVSTISRDSPYCSVGRKHVYIRFEEKDDYILWLEYLRNAIREAKDQSWSKTNELFI